MTKERLNEIVVKKGYNENLIQWIEMFLPLMESTIGEKNIEKVLTEWTINISRKGLTERGTTGLCDRKDKTITGLWYGKGNKDLAASLLLHEAGHASGYLDGPDGTFLKEGGKESFFRKLEEALVSEAENKVKSGEFNYQYYGLFDFNTQSNIGSFKSPSRKYSVEFGFFQNLKLLLGKRAKLIYENMYAEQYEQKCALYEEANKLLMQELSEEQYRTMINSLNVLVLNSGYGNQVLTETMEQMKKRMYEENKQEYPDFNQFEKEFEEWIKKDFPMSYEYAKKNGILDKTNLEAVDDLCEITIDVLTDRLQNPNYDYFEALKQVSQYFVRLDNKSDRLSPKTENLREMYKEVLSKIDIKCDRLSEDEKQLFLMQILSLDEIGIEDIKQLKTIEIDEENITTNENMQIEKAFFSIGEFGMFSLKKAKNTEKTAKLDDLFMIGDDSDEETMDNDILVSREGFEITLPNGEKIYSLVNSDENRQKIQNKINQADVAINFSRVDMSKGILGNSLKDTSTQVFNEREEKNNDIRASAIEATKSIVKTKTMETSFYNIKKIRQDLSKEYNMKENETYKG